MLRVVTKCPVLAVSFTRLASWSCLTEEVSDVLQSNAEIMLNAFIQAANTVGPAVIALRFRLSWPESPFCPSAHAAAWLSSLPWHSAPQN